jgi:hypothetical protein
VADNNQRQKEGPEYGKKDQDAFEGTEGNAGNRVFSTKYLSIYIKVSEMS